MDDSPRVQALRLALAALLDEVAGEQWIRAVLAAELDAQDPHAEQG